MCVCERLCMCTSVLVHECMCVCAHQHYLSMLLPLWCSPVGAFSLSLLPWAWKCHCVSCWVTTSTSKSFILPPLPQTRTFDFLVSCHPTLCLLCYSLLWTSDCSCSSTDFSSWLTIISFSLRPPLFEYLDGTSWPVISFGLLPSGDLIPAPFLYPASTTPSQDSRVGSRVAPPAHHFKFRHPTL